MTAFPTIQSIGPPPERHAERMAAEFTRWLIAEHRRREPGCRHIIKTRNDGNPKAQQKMFDRFLEASGPTVLTGILQTGKRRKYEIILHRWLGWYHNGFIHLKDPIPEKPWLAVVLERIVSTYAGGDHQHVITALISQHAIARLAERCGARNPLDVVELTRAMSVAMVKALGAQPPTIDLKAPPPEGWRIPFKGGTAVVRLDEESKLPLIATVLGLEG